MAGKERINIMDQGKMKALANLEPAMLEKVLDLAANARLIDCVDSLKECGIEVSVSTLSRFLKEYRAKQLVEAGEAVKGAAESLARRGETGAFRKGTMEAVRQRLFETALESENGEEARKLYVELLKEETKLKELQLAERRVALAEESERNRRAELRAARRRKMVLEDGAEPTEIEDAEVKQLPEAVVNSELGGRVKELENLLREVAEILNRGGESAEGRLLEARSVMGSGQRLLGTG